MGVLNLLFMLGRKEKQDRSSSRGGRNVQNPSRPAPQPVPEEKGKERDPQVGDIDSQGFGIGVVPSHLQATQGNPVTTAAKKSSKYIHSNQQATGALEVGRDQLANQDTSSSSLSSLRELTDAPPTKQEVCYFSYLVIYLFILMVIILVDFSGYLEGRSKGILITHHSDSFEPLLRRKEYYLIWYIHARGRTRLSWLRVVNFQPIAAFNRILPKCNDRNKKPKRPFSLGKLTNFTRKLANFGTFLKLKML